MSTNIITQDYVQDRSSSLPGFPSIIRKIIDTIEKPDANLSELEELISLEPLITGRVMSFANSAAMHRLRESRITDIHSAISMIGLTSVRDIAIASSFTMLCGETKMRNHVGFIRHSLSVSSCSKELAMHIENPINVEMAQIGGLLHDIGHLWLSHFEPVRFAQTRKYALENNLEISIAELREFNVSHETIGTWLAEFWQLPEELIPAISNHHNPENSQSPTLAALIHVSEALSYALDLPGYGDRVSRLSAEACGMLGLSWDESSQDLFGRIEARSRNSALFLN